MTPLKLIYEVSRSFMATHHREDLSLFELCWDNIKDLLGTPPPVGMFSKEFLPRIGLGNYEPSSLAAIMLISVVSTLLTKLSTIPVKPDKKVLRELFDAISKDHGLPKTLQTKMANHILPLVLEVGFFETLKGRLSEMRRVIRNGKADLVRIEETDHMLGDASFHITVDLINRSVCLRPDGTKSRYITLRPMDLKVLSHLCENAYRPIPASSFESIFGAVEVDSMKTSVRQSIVRLRAHPELRKWVETSERREGYRIRDGIKVIVVTDSIVPITSRGDSPVR